MLYRAIRYILFKLPPEVSHYVALELLKLGSLLGVNQLLTRFNHRNLGSTANCTTKRIMSLDFPNPVGIAAGLDKNGDYISVFESLGFGFIEIGTVTPRPQPGNPKPRLFRLPEKSAIINRMGFNNKGVDYLVEKVKQSKHKVPLGINIGKNFDTPIDKAIDDYLICFNKVYNYADYIVINISSPNTPGLRNLQHGSHLEDLLRVLKQEQAIQAEKFNKYVPLVVKVAPDLEQDEVENMAKIFLNYGVDGLITTNTTIDKSSVSKFFHGEEAGGLSGEPVFLKSLQTQQAFYKLLADKIPIIGVGGIMDEKSALDRLNNGASLIQIYTGFIFQGPTLIIKILRELKCLKIKNPTLKY